MDHMRYLGKQAGVSAALKLRELMRELLWKMATKRRQKQGQNIEEGFRNIGRAFQGEVRKAKLSWN